MVKENATNRFVYLPGSNDELWYNTEQSLLYPAGNYNINVDNETNLYFYKGGTIVARRDSFTQSATESIHYPLDLYIFLNSSNAAVGTLYVDDGITFEYQNKHEYIYREYSYVDGVLSFRNIDNDANFNGNVVLGSVVIYRPPSSDFKVGEDKVEGCKPSIEVVEVDDIDLYLV